ncbi:MAG: ATP-binding protein [Atopobiaceae bacterium]
MEHEWARDDDTLLDAAKTAGILLATIGLSEAFDLLGFSEASLVITFVLGVILIAIVTPKRSYCLVASALSVLAFNYFFTSPRYSLQALGNQYPTTFATMFVVALLSSWLAMGLRMRAEESAAATRRTKVLLETDQLLQRCRTADEIVEAMAHQLARLEGRAVVWRPSTDSGLGEPVSFVAGETAVPSPDELRRDEGVAAWVCEHNRMAGPTTDSFPKAHGIYLAVRSETTVFGVIGILNGDVGHDSSERNIVLAIVGEAALALERDRALREREQAAVLAKNEQLRADLLRSISHDLRTPLTAISGNADILLDEGTTLDEAARHHLLADIYDDALWLNDLVENLLAVTKLENGTLRLNVSCELVEEVIDEAMLHVSRKAAEHEISVDNEDDLLLARMDAHLVVQVIVNLVNNAIQYTPTGSRILVSSHREGDLAVIAVSDDGPGIADADKQRIFESFYTVGRSLADGRRSMGLGLALCRSIVNALGGTIEARDNAPKGTSFVFTLPAEEAPTNGKG